MCGGLSRRNLMRPKCSPEHRARFPGPASRGKLLQVNAHFRLCHSVVDPSGFYKQCVSDLCLYEELQAALCHSLAECTSVCLSHKAAVYAWRSPGFSASADVLTGLDQLIPCNLCWFAFSIIDTKFIYGVCKCHLLVYIVIEHKRINSI